MFKLNKAKYINNDIKLFIKYLLKKLKIKIKL
jgi:hypothetical protein